MTDRLFEHSPQGVARISPDGTVREANRALARLLRATPGELIGRSWVSLIAPAYRNDEEAQLGVLLADQRTCSEGTAVLDVDQSRIVITRWRANEAVFVCVRRAEPELDCGQKELAHLGQMASIVAHEVRNPMAGIIGGLQVIGGLLPEGSGERNIVKMMVTRLRSLDRSMEDLLAFARPSLPDRAPVELRALFESTVKMLTLDPDCAAINVELDGPPSVIDGDADLLSRAFLNLLINSAQAMKGRGSIQVKLRHEGSSCRIELHDSGPGIPVDIRAKIFEPFFTTKSKGTGVGLAVARRSIEAHGGTIALDDSVAQGTTFVVLLPLPV